MPPKRMSDILPSSSLDARTGSTSAATAPYSSEGPSLPVLTAGVVAGAGEEGAGGGARGMKRKRGGSAAGKGERRGTMGENTAQGKKEVPVTVSATATATNHPSLYAPWELLPLGLRGQVGLGGDVDTDADADADADKAQAQRPSKAKQRITVLVWSRNQNIRAGVNKLKALLCAPPLDPASGETETDTDTLIAISAQAEGTVKLVGIVDLACRVVGGEGRCAVESPAREEGGGEGTEKEEKQTQGKGKAKETKALKWYMYTVLSSVVIPSAKQRAQLPVDATGANGAGEADTEGEGEGEAMDLDTPSDPQRDASANGAGGPVKPHDSAEPQAMKTAPVLTVWLARRRISRWAEAFGEREVVVRGDVG